MQVSYALTRKKSSVQFVEYFINLFISRRDLELTFRNRLCLHQWYIASSGKYALIEKYEWKVVGSFEMASNR
jgi:hypothetical protein